MMVVSQFTCFGGVGCFGPGRRPGGGFRRRPGRPNFRPGGSDFFPGGFRPNPNFRPNLNFRPRPGFGFGFFG